MPEQLTREFTLAWRRIRASPGAVVFAIVTLALGIGVTVATYSVVYSGLWRPLGIADEDRLVLIGRTNSVSPRSLPISWRDYDGLVHEHHNFEAVAAWTMCRTVLAAGGTAELTIGDAVTGGYFSMLGIAAARGRLLEPDDDRADASPAVVLSYSAWRDQLGSDPAIVGKTVKIAGAPLTVVGVAPAGFRGVNGDGFVSRGFWIPVALLPRLDSANAALFDPERGRSVLTVGLRFKGSQTFASAGEALTTVGQRIEDAQRRPDPPGGPATPRTFRYWTAVHVTDNNRVNEGDAIGRIIVGLPALVLLIACTNIANLVLSRGASRRHDFGVRRALGASRWQLVREQLVEQTVIVLAGGVMGVVVATGLVRVAAAFTREMLAPFIPGTSLDWSLDAGVLTSTGVAVLLSIVVAGIVPALHLTRDSLRTVLAQGNAGSTPRWRGRGNLIALQLGVSVGLFLVAVVFVRMLFDEPIVKGARGPLAPLTAGMERLAVASIPFEFQQRDEADGIAATTSILKTLRDTPGIEATGASTQVATSKFASRELSATVAMPGEPFVRGDRRGEVAYFAAVSPGAFDALGTTVQRGRAFDERDSRESAPVVIVNDTLAREVLGTEEAVGRSIAVRVSGRSGTQRTERTTTATVVGIVSGSHVVGSRGNYRELYAPLAQQYAPTVAIFARATDGSAPVEAVRAAIRKTDAELAVSFVAPMPVLANGPIAFVGYVAGVLLALASLALGLSMTGLYGVLSHVMARRTREMGIRMAVGATKTHIIRLVIKDGFRPIVEGLFIGLATATVIRVFLKTALLAETVAPLDVVACAAATGLLAAAGALACYLPARRAASVDPNVALRDL